MDTIVTPASATGTVVTGNAGGHWNHRGLEGKDVAAINEMFTLQTLRGVTTDIHQSARDIEVNVEKSGRANELATEKTAAASQLFLSTNFAAASLAAATNTAAIQASLAEDACEIKELIRADGQSTRDLINNLNVQSLQAQLAAATNEANMLKLKIAGIAVPV